MKDTLITACSVVAVIALSIGIGELAFLGYQPGSVATEQVAQSHN
jgi:hypothetical protein